MVIHSRRQGFYLRSRRAIYRMTILSASSGNGRCSVFASSHGPRIHTSRASSITGLFQFFHLCWHIGISANSVSGILARQNPDIVIRL